MKSFEIQFHKAKNAANKLKHKGISLAETEPVFHDERALTIQDDHHNEARWITIGLDGKVVCWWWLTPIGTLILFESFPRASPARASATSTWRLDR
jgi:uncharacterized DUF497 family protein